MEKHNNNKKKLEKEHLKSLCGSFFDCKTLE